MQKFFVANDKGGTGKSLLAQYLIIALRAAKRDPAIFEYDQHPKQCRWFGANAVQTSPMSPPLLDLQRDPMLALRFWDPLMQPLSDERDLVVDLGAQAWTGFHQWLRASGLTMLLPTLEPTVLIPFTADVEAARGALRIIKDVTADLPRAQLVLMRLDRDGDVEMLRGTPEIEEILTLLRQPRIAMRTFPVLRAEAYACLNARGFRLDQMANLKPGEFQVDGVSDLAVARTVVAVRAWMTDMYRALLPIILGTGSPTQSAPAPASAPTPAASNPPPTAPAAVRPVAQAAPTNQSNQLPRLPTQFAPASTPTPAASNPPPTAPTAVRPVAQAVTTNQFNQLPELPMQSSPAPTATASNPPPNAPPVIMRPVGQPQPLPMYQFNQFNQ
ncbi:hypothetical protein SAMN05421644_11158 [Allochromatium warmingii]|uniref:Uncharacterized protein n=1 Tax=Allochromatium warmingii TaxID=61595 RepID=A0A1H3E5F4_ALLWA|nr:hypothetical protein [Allochromatium warmingii]SDX73926.1 hypothetical protein SAMN05421644_11158 [Allochromatium warmingii]